MKVIGTGEFPKLDSVGQKRLFLIRIGTVDQHMVGAGQRVAAGRTQKLIKQNGLAHPD